MKHRKLKIALWVIAGVIIFFVADFFIFVGGYYRADNVAIEAMETADVEIRTGDGYIAYVPEGAETGIIFYPGGKVEYTAYAPLMLELADKGFACILVEMPYNLAVFDINAADGLQSVLPEVEHWYIGGHSLGGAMAASYVSKHESEYDGLILLAAYSTSDLSDTDLEVVSVYGENDGVMKMGKHDKCLENLPDDTVEEVIEGGCHAYFGSYGRQDGDGIPTITNARQIEEAADIIAQNIAA